MSDQCSDALHELDRFLDGELDDHARSKLEAHLNLCSPCLEAYDFESELRALIRQRCVSRAPDALRDRIKSVIQNECECSGSSEQPHSS